MPKIFLIVKGNRHITEAAAEQHKVKLEIDSESELYNQTNCYASLSDKDKIIAWYAEDAGIVKPTSPGEILWYSCPQPELE